MRISAESVPPRLVASSSFVTQHVVGRAAAKRSSDCFDRASLCSGGQDEARLEAIARIRKCLELARETRIALAQAGAVDQHQATLANVIEQLGELGRAVDRVRRHAEQATECVNLFLRADADAVGRHERDVARAMTQDPASSELRDQRGLADAGRTDHRDDAAAFHPALADGLDATSHQREREALRFRQFHPLRQLAHQFAGEIVREAEHCQLTQQLRLDRRATRQVVPRERRELRLQHAAQGAQFFISISG